MSSKTLIKCAHPHCQCLIEAEQQFCSATCASAKGASRGPCLCGHAGCIGEHDNPDERDPDLLDDADEPDPLTTK